MEKVNSSPNFTVEAFFYFLFSMMVVSFVAFLLMDLLPSMKNDHDLIDDKTDDRSEDNDEANKCMLMNGKQSASFLRTNIPVPDPNHD